MNHTKKNELIMSISEIKKLVEVDGDLYTIIISEQNYRCLYAKKGCNLRELKKQGERPIDHGKEIKDIHNFISESHKILKSC